MHVFDAGTCRSSSASKLCIDVSCDCLWLPSSPLLLPPVLLLQLPQRSKPGDIIVEGVDYDPEDLYSTDSSSSSSTHDADSDTGSSDSERDTRPWSQRFPALHAAVATAISELGGAVAPRLNWSSPTDALWLTSSNSLRCTNPDEVSLGEVARDKVEWVGVRGPWWE